MSVNVLFMVGLVFVPGLWSIVEYLFPLAFVAFAAIGVWAFRQLGDFFGRMFTHGGFDCAKNNSFAQMLPAFALAMVGVVLAAPAAMSLVPLTAGLSHILSTFFIVAALILGVVSLYLGFRTMMEHGADVADAPTFCVAIPIVTVVSIAQMRQDHGLQQHFNVHANANNIPSHGPGSASRAVLLPRRHGPGCASFARRSNGRRNPTRPTQLRHCPRFSGQRQRRAA